MAQARQMKGGLAKLQRLQVRWLMSMRRRLGEGGLRYHFPAASAKHTDLCVQGGCPFPTTSTPPFSLYSSPPPPPSTPPPPPPPYSPLPSPPLPPQAELDLLSSRVPELEARATRADTLLPKLEERR